MAVHEGQVKSPFVQEHPARDENTGPGDGLEATRLIDSGMILWEAPVNVSRDSVLTDNDAGVLNRVVRIKQLAADDSGVRVAVGVADQGL